jgi:sulfopyruvate decarboxylase TPP-binding subunit
VPAKVIPREFSGDAATLRQQSQRIVDALIELGTTHAVGVPDNATRIVYELLEAEPRVQVVPVCREGEAWAIASGLWAGGREPVVIIQNTGLFESGDALRGTAIEMGVPLLAVMDYRGHHTLGGPADAIDSAAAFFEPTLRAWQVPYHFLEDHEEVRIMADAKREAEKRGGPVAVLMR